MRKERAARNTSASTNTHHCLISRFSIAPRYLALSTAMMLSQPLGYILASKMAAAPRHAADDDSNYFGRHFVRRRPRGIDDAFRFFASRWISRAGNEGARGRGAADDVMTPLTQLAPPHGRRDVTLADKRRAPFSRAGPLLRISSH